MVEIAGAHVQVLCEPGTDGTPRLGVARTRGPVVIETGHEWAWILVERGSGTVALDEIQYAVVGRASVFDGPGWSCTLDTTRRAHLDGDLDATVVWRLADDTDACPTDIVPADAVEVVERGTGTTRRTVRTSLASGPLLAGETLNPPGGWSSWPPHAHAHEEIYLYRFDPPHGFGVHVDVGADAVRPGDDAPRVVRDGDLVRIESGHHPVVAAPGCTMYYLWVLAGDGPLETRIDSRFA